MVDKPGETDRWNFVVSTWIWSPCPGGVEPTTLTDTGRKICKT